MTMCDNCNKKLDFSGQFLWIVLPVDIKYCKQGNRAIVCSVCNEMIIKKTTEIVDQVNISDSNKLDDIDDIQLLTELDEE